MTNNSEMCYVNDVYYLKNMYRIYTVCKKKKKYKVPESWFLCHFGTLENNKPDTWQNTLGKTKTRGLNGQLSKWNILHPPVLFLKQLHYVSFQNITREHGTGMSDIKLKKESYVSVTQSISLQDQGRCLWFSWHNSWVWCPITNVQGAGPPREVLLVGFVAKQPDAFIFVIQWVRQL